MGGPIIGLIAENAGPRWELSLGAIAALSAAALGAGALMKLKGD